MINTKKKKYSQTAFDIEASGELRIIRLGHIPDVSRAQQEFRIAREDKELLRELESKPLIVSNIAKMSDYHLNVLCRLGNPSNKELIEIELNRRKLQDRTEELKKILKGEPASHCC